jgi:hypothetical protein
MYVDIPHVMIDLETMGTSCIAAPMSIGAVVFTMDGKILERYHTGVELKSCVSIGMELDVDTVEWWMKQSKENQNRVMELKKKPIAHALGQMEDMFRRRDLNKYMTCVWSHGSNFDTVILTNAYKLLGSEVWWKYSNVRDTRTLFDVAGYDYTAKGSHDALEDAENQALAVVAAYKQLMKGGKNGSNRQKV